jgi:hypothetical protein
LILNLIHYFKNINHTFVTLKYFQITHLNSMLMFRLLFTLTFFFLCTFSQAQTSDSTKSYFRVYFDLELGTLSMGGEGFSILGVSSISAGFRINRQIALGLSLRTWSQPSSCCGHQASGRGVQFRLSPTELPFLIKVETGYLTSASYGDDGNYLSKYNPDKSDKTYTSVSIAARFSKIWTLGLGWASTTNQINDRFDYGTKAFLGTSKFGVSEVSLIIGIAIPK